jgi:hypothetical protein
MASSRNMIVIVATVYSTAEKHPVSLFLCDEEYGMRRVENVTAYECGDFTLIRG